MAHVWGDRVLETSTTTGTGAVTLDAAITGYQRFSAVCSTSDTVYYSIFAVDANGNPSGDWETGLGTYSSANTLTRTTPSASTNGGAAVDFAAGTKYVMLTPTAGYISGPLPVTAGGTGTATALTAGSIVFAGASGVYSQDNSKLFWDDTNNRLGVGTAAPAYLIDLYDATNATFGISSDAAAQLQVQRSQTGANGGTLAFRKTRGTVASPTAVASADQMGAMRFLAYGGTNYRAIATIEAYVDTYTSNTDISSYISLYTTPGGSITAVERFRIGPAGQLGIGGATYGTSGQALLSQGSASPPVWGSVASQTQTAEQISGFIASPSDKSYTIALKMAHAGTVTETTTISASGTCTATFKVNSTALGGTANSVSSSEQSQSHSGTNTFAAGDDIVLTVSSNSSCADMSFTIKYTRTLA